MKASLNCIALIKRFEGFVPSPYRCPAGVPTIGFGSTRDTDGKAISMNHQPISEAQATQLMYATLKTYEDAVNRYVQVPLTQNQFDALTDFCYNAGAQNLRTSTLLKKLNVKDYNGCAEQFLFWVYGGGKRLNGLVKRRMAERSLFLSIEQPIC